MNSLALNESTEPVDAQVNGNSLGAGEIRLNLGGRGTKIPGFLTVDLSKEHDVDMSADVSKLPIEDDSVSEIYASQILEHFPHVQTLDVLSEWHRVLRPKGKIVIGVPDFDRAVALYKQYGLTDYICNFLYGDQTYDLAYHYAPFTFARLAGLLSKGGFVGIKRLTVMPHGLADCSDQVCNADGKPVSLNVEAFKCA